MTPFAVARVLHVAVAALLVGGAATPATAATYTRIALKTAYGEAAEVTAVGTAYRPKAVYVSTRALPAQKVLVKYAVVCTRGTLVRTKVGFHTTSSFAKRKLKLPMMTPDSCKVSASGKIAAAGQVTVRIYKR
ncbi:MAG: hypothetical protein QOI64_226 [Solirubrobacteraceae bacterium]|nr:hypothetical protein [Solirubrobacteraceae bacterium]